MYLNPNTNIQGDLVLVDNPSTKVVSVTDIKAHLRIDTSDEDDLLGVYIDAATEMAEHFCNRHFITHEYSLYFNSVKPQASLIFPDCTLINVEADPGPPIVAAEYAVNWVDTDGNTQGSHNAYIDAHSNPSIVYLNSDFTSPTLKSNAANTFWFEFKTGFGGVTDVPEAIKQAIKLIVSDMYYFREDRKRRFPMASEILLQPYKCYH